MVRPEKRNHFDLGILWVCLSGVHSNHSNVTIWYFVDDDVLVIVAMSMEWNKNM